MKFFTVKAKSYYNWTHCYAGYDQASGGFKCKIVRWVLLGMCVYKRRYVYDCRLHTVARVPHSLSKWKRIEIAGRGVPSHWHSVGLGQAYQRFRTYEAAAENARKHGGIVINGDVHDLMIGITC